MHWMEEVPEGVYAFYKCKPVEHDIQNMIMEYMYKRTWRMSSFNSKSILASARLELIKQCLSFDSHADRRIDVHGVQDLMTQT